MFFMLCGAHVFDKEDGKSSNLAQVAMKFLCVLAFVCFVCCAVGSCVHSVCCCLFSGVGSSSGPILGVVGAS